MRCMKYLKLNYAHMHVLFIDVYSIAAITLQWVAILAECMPKFDSYLANTLIFSTTSQERVSS